MAEIFDDLTRILGSGLSRREAIKLVVTGLAGTYLTALWPGRAFAGSGVSSRHCDTGGEECYTGALKQCCEKGLTCCVKNRLCCDTKIEDCCAGENLHLCCPPTKCCRDIRNVDCCVETHCCVDGHCARGCPKGNAPNDTLCCLVTGGTTCCNPKTHCCDREGKKGCVPKSGFRLTSYTSTGIEVEVLAYAGSGLATIDVVQAVNATVEIPSFPFGATYVEVHAYKVNLTKPSRIVLRACTTDGCCENGDPVLTQLQIPPDQNRVRESFRGIPSIERFVSIQNGSHGFRRLQILVNGERAQVVRLQPGENRTVDIAQALTKPRNVVTLIGHGSPGSSALIVIADVPSAKADDAVSLPYVPWEEREWEPGVDMRWGM